MQNFIIQGTVRGQNKVSVNYHIEYLIAQKSFNKGFSYSHKIDEHWSQLMQFVLLYIVPLMLIFFFSFFKIFLMYCTLKFLEIGQDAWINSKNYYKSVHKLLSMMDWKLNSVSSGEYVKWKNNVFDLHRPKLLTEQHRFRIY